MKTYKVLLHRDYIVHIDAKNEADAISLTEFFIAWEKDASNDKEQKQYGFRINEIEMVTNDAFKAEEVRETV